MASIATARLTAANKDAWIDRIRRIQPGAKPRFGSMTPEALFAHLTRTLEISLGEAVLPDMSTPVTRTILKWMFFDLPIPWPKGKIKAPEEFTPRPAGNFEDERRRLFDSIQRFAAAQSAAPRRKVLSPLLGMQTLIFWGRIHGRHMEHHMRQFGV